MNEHSKLADAFRMAADEAQKEKDEIYAEITALTGRLYDEINKLKEQNKDKLRRIAAILQEDDF